MKALVCAACTKLYDLVVALVALATHDRFLLQAKQGFKVHKKVTLLEDSQVFPARGILFMFVFLIISQ